MLRPRSRRTTFPSLSSVTKVGRRSVARTRDGRSVGQRCPAGVSTHPRRGNTPVAAGTAPRVRRAPRSTCRSHLTVAESLSGASRAPCPSSTSTPRPDCMTPPACTTTRGRPPTARHAARDMTRQIISSSVFRGRRRAGLSAREVHVRIVPARRVHEVGYLVAVVAPG